jgi:MFS family permease
MFSAALLVPTAGVLPVFLLGGLSVQIREELGFGESGLGTLVAVFFGAGAVGAAIAGRLVHRAGALPSMRIGAAIAIACLLGVAGAARSLPVLLAFLVVGGFGNVVCQLGSNAVIASRVRVGRQGLAFAAKQSSIPLATLLGGLAVPTIALTVGWRWAYVAGAGLALAALLTVLAGDEVAAQERAARPAGPLPLAPLSVLAAAGGLGAAAGGVIGSFLVASAVEVGMGQDEAGTLLAVVSACILATRLVMGLVADRRGRGFFELVAGMLALGALGFVLLTGSAIRPFVIGAVLAGVAAWGWPGLFNLAVVAYDRNLAAIATGVTQTGVYLGAVFGPILFGVVAERASFPAAWLLAAAVSLLAAGMMLLGRSFLRRASALRAPLAREGPAGGS